jgi:hypothetical protein
VISVEKLVEVEQLEFSRFPTGIKCNNDNLRFNKIFFQLVMLDLQQLHQFSTCYTPTVIGFKLTTVAGEKLSAGVLSATVRA